ncbi:alpha/beta hydrolase [Allonocardiopsis opalescens]|uniref:Arylformamidase n=1 Tax=Allonocardiopsis opalescens TaxID=1144618 RepID=A0A2T0Q425_9ACTN|nr:alpha/beta hydrolase [Allonocardiopsis opalescens]PRX98542.1 arylformamidase [Allonocardiopsis opalescens]
MANTAAGGVYRGWDRAALDRLYSPSVTVPDIRRYLDEYARLSAHARRTHRVLAGLRYGPSPAERLDFFPAERPGAPVLVYVHGGYWQELSKDESAFCAPGFLAQGTAFAALDYGLAPAHRLDEIVAMVRRAVRWLVGQAPRLGVDPRRVHLAGSSAGAHLAAMALTPDRARRGLPEAGPVAGVALLSGVYDLEPVSHTYVNEALALSLADALRNSPRWLPIPEVLPPVVIARGENETPEFVRQHDEMAAALRSAGADPVEVVGRGRNHFDLPYDLGDPATELGAAVRGQLAGG